MEERAVIIEDIAIRKKTFCPSPHDVKMLQLVRIPAETVQIASQFRNTED
jgi:hypothetical protein